jgi:lipopolysaccharide export LptBFGC system permease protein LptF
MLNTVKSNYQAQAVKAMQNNELGKAIFYYDAAIALNDENVGLYIERANVYQMLGHFPEAAIDYYHAILKNITDFAKLAVKQKELVADFSKLNRNLIQKLGQNQLAVSKRLAENEKAAYQDYLIELADDAKITHPAYQTAAFQALEIEMGVQLLAKYAEYTQNENLAILVAAFHEEQKLIAI